MSRAIAKFNYKPSLGIKTLRDCQLINTDDPAEVAFFLKNTEGIDKTVLGDYLGSERYAEILAEFVKLYDFSRFKLVDGLRSFLSGFRLPGEGQKVDRIMQQFAQKYYQDTTHF